MKRPIRSTALAATLAVLATAAAAQQPATPAPAPGARPAAPVDRGGLDRAALEAAIQRAVQNAVDRASAEALDRLQRSPLAAEAAALRQKVEDIDRLREEMRREIAQARSAVIGALIWGAVGLFLLMVVASVLGGAIVAMVFGGRRPRV